MSLSITERRSSIHSDSSGCIQENDPQSLQTQLDYYRARRIGLVGFDNKKARRSTNRQIAKLEVKLGIRGSRPPSFHPTSTHTFSRSSSSSNSTTTQVFVSSMQPQTTTNQVFIQRWQGKNEGHVQPRAPSTTSNQVLIQVGQAGNGSHVQPRAPSITNNQALIQGRQVGNDGLVQSHPQRSQAPQPQGRVPTDIFKGTFDHLHRELDIVTARNKELKEQNTRLEQEIGVLNLEKSGLQSVVEALTGRVGRRDKTIAELMQFVAKLQNEIKWLSDESVV